MKCRHCNAPVTLLFADLGSSPPSNSYITQDKFFDPETWYPLRVLTCTNCWLVQTQDFAKRDELFSSDYAYFSSFSEIWLRHSEKYVDEMVDRFGFDSKSLVVEVASNDGYLLQYVKVRGMAALGIEPTASTAKVSREKGIETIEEFFGVALAERLVAGGKSADLTAANNVLAHVPDINDFVAGFAVLLKPAGVSTFEFPHLLRLVEGCQFDTIYHEHYSYLSLTAVQSIFTMNGLQIFDVEEVSTHGGSLRVFAQRSATGEHPISDRVGAMLEHERAQGVNTEGFYVSLQQAAERIATALVEFLAKAHKDGKLVVGYGAAAKGNTLMNFAGVRPHLLSWIVDRNPAKQNTLAPGSRIPIVDEAKIRAEKPDYLMILPWNIRTEVVEQLGYIREWGGKFVVAVPSLSVE